MKKFLILFFLLIPVIAFAETITLKSGRVIEDEVLERTDEYEKCQVDIDNLSWDEWEKCDGKIVKFIFKGSKACCFLSQHPTNVPLRVEGIKENGFPNIIYSKHEIYRMIGGWEVVIASENEISCAECDDIEVEGVLRIEGYGKGKGKDGYRNPWISLNQCNCLEAVDSESVK